MCQVIIMTPLKVTLERTKCGVRVRVRVRVPNLQTQTDLFLITFLFAQPFNLKTEKLLN